MVIWKWKIFGVWRHPPILKNFPNVHALPRAIKFTLVSKASFIFKGKLSLWLDQWGLFFNPLYLERPLYLILAKINPFILGNLTTLVYSPGVWVSEWVRVKNGEKKWIVSVQKVTRSHGKKTLELEEDTRQKAAICHKSSVLKRVSFPHGLIRNIPVKARQSKEGQGRAMLSKDWIKKKKDGSREWAGLFPSFSWLLEVNLSLFQGLLI